jgi:hypothetical protein
LFVLRIGTGVAYLPLYVDDMILSASSTSLLQQMIAKIKSEFAVKDMGMSGIDPLGTARKLPVRKKKSDSY